MEEGERGKRKNEAEVWVEGCKDEEGGEWGNLVTRLRNT